MTRKELLILQTTSSSILADYKLIQKGYLCEPFVSKYLGIDKQELTSSYYEVYSPRTNDKVYFLTVLSYYNNEYILKCSDPYIEGQLTIETMNKLIENALHKTDQKNNSVLSTLLKDGFNVAPRSTACNFNQKNFTRVSPLCVHLSFFLDKLPDTVIDTVYQNYNSAKSPSPDSDSSSHSIGARFKRYSFKKHLLLEGDKGSGKTHFTTSWARKKNIKTLFIGGHEQFESMDFLGHFIQRRDGSLLWKDGALSEAFRLAGSGIKTLLIIDEMLRIPKRELNLLVSALSPIGGKYLLRSGRAVDEKDDIAVEEVLSAPVENLWIIGTSNVGEDYAVESIDEALIDRFKPIRKETQDSEIESILIKETLAKSFSTQSVEYLMLFYKKMKHMKKTKLITKLVNLRHLKEAIEFSDRESDVKTIIEDSVLLFVERDADGRPNSEQVDTVQSIIRAVWK